MLLAFAYALFRERWALSRMARLDARHIAMMSATVWLSIFITGSTTRLYLRRLGVPLTVGESFWLAAANFLCSFLPLQLNLLIRGKYLKQLHSLSYSSYTAMVVVNLLVMFCAIGVYGLLTLTFISWRRSVNESEMYVAFVCCAIIPPAIGWLFVRTDQARRSNGRSTSPVVQAILILCQSKRCLVRAVMLTVLALFVLSFRFYLASERTGIDRRLELATLLAPVATLSMYLAITPSALGVREFASSGLSRLLGLDYTTGLAVSTIERGVAVVWYVLLGLLGALILGKRFQTHKSDGN